MTDTNSEIENTSAAAVVEVSAPLNKNEEENGEATEQSIPVDNLKHPLQNSWTLWFYKTDRTKDYKDSFRQISKFDTVEDFWALYNHIQLSSKLSNGCDYCIFKDGIKPMWEDAANAKGGKWQMEINKSQRSTDLDKCWLEILFLLIGEGFGDDTDFLNGGIVQARNKKDRLAIWLMDYKKKEAVMRIGNILKEKLNLTRKNELQFYTHEDTATAGNSAKYISI